MDKFLISLFTVPIKLLCGAALVAGIFMIGYGFKGDPVDFERGFKGLGLLLLAIICFPSKKHILYRFWVKSRSSSQDDLIADPVPERDEPYRTRVRLDIVVPPSNPQDATSWLGGLPKLPSDVKWPLTPEHKNPMLFVAQIAMKDLPKELWGGAGPRTGALAFFVDPRYPQDSAAVLNLQGVLEERKYPKPIDAIQYYPILRTSAPAPDEANAPYLTKWAVRAERLAEGVETPSPYFKYKDPKNIASEHRRNANLSEPAFLPYNWMTLLHLVSTLGAKQNRILRDFERRKNNPPDDVLASLKSRKLAAGALAGLGSELNKIKHSEKFTRQLRDAVMEKLQNIMVRGVIFVNDDLTGKSKPELQDVVSVLADIDMSWYYTGFEHLCRAIYAKDPQKFPTKIRATFEPLWNYDAGFEVAVMGGQVDISRYVAAPAEKVCLIEIPKSELIGTDWHDMSSLGIFIDPDDLRSGNFSSVYCEISES